MADQERSERPGWWARFKQQAKALKREVLALNYAVHDPRTPWAAKLLPFFVIAYALSPLDLIPDFIPVLGLLDDLVLLPGLIWLAIWLIPPQVMEDCRAQAEHEPLRLSRAWHVAGFIAAGWIAALLLGVHYAIRAFGTQVLREYEWAVLTGTGVLCCIMFVVWLVLGIREERRKRSELSATLISNEGGSSAPLSGDEAV